MRNKSAARGLTTSSRTKVFLETGLIILSLPYAEGSFQRDLMIACTSGWDTDCNAGNTGCLMGVKNGLPGIEDGPDFREREAPGTGKITASKPPSFPGSPGHLVWRPASKVSCVITRSCLARANGCSLYGSAMAFRCWQNGRLNGVGSVRTSLCWR